MPLLLACLVSALACAQTTSAFSHGDLLLSSFSGKGLSTLQLVVPAPPLSAFLGHRAVASTGSALRLELQSG